MKKNYVPFGLLVLISISTQNEPQTGETIVDSIQVTLMQKKIVVISSSFTRERIVAAFAPPQTNVGEKITKEIASIERIITSKISSLSEKGAEVCQMLKNGKISKGSAAENVAIAFIGKTFFATEIYLRAHDGKELRALFPGETGETSVANLLSLLSDEKSKFTKWTAGLEK